MEAQSMLSLSLSQIWGSNASAASPTDLSLWLIPQCLWSQVENTCLFPHCSLWLGVLFCPTGIKLQGYRIHLKLMGQHQERFGAGISGKRKAGVGRGAHAQKQCEKVLPLVLYLWCHGEGRLHFLQAPPSHTGKQLE